MAPQTFWWCFLEESGHAEDHLRRALRPMLAWLLVCLQGVSGGLGEIHREALRWIIGETTGPPRRWRKSGKPQKREHISQRKIGNKNQHFSGGYGLCWLSAEQITWIPNVQWFKMVILFGFAQNLLASWILMFGQNAFAVVTGLLGVAQQIWHKCGASWSCMKMGTAISSGTNE